MSIEEMNARANKEMRELMNVRKEWLADKINTILLMPVEQRGTAMIELYVKGVFDGFAVAERAVNIALGKT